MCGQCEWRSRPVEGEGGADGGGEGGEGDGVGGGARGSCGGGGGGGGEGEGDEANEEELPLLLTDGRGAQARHDKYALSLL